MCTPGRCWEARSSTAEDFFVDRRQSSHGRRLAKSLGVALKRAFMNSSELSVGSIRVFLFADVLADLLQFEPNGGHRITAGPEVLASEVSFLTSGESRCTCVRGPASDALRLSGILSAVPTHGKLVPIADVLARKAPCVVPWAQTRRDTCSSTWSGIGFRTDPTLDPPLVGHQATWGGSYSRNGQTCSSRTGRTSGLPNSVSGRNRLRSHGRARLVAVSGRGKRAGEAERCVGFEGNAHARLGDF